MVKEKSQLEEMKRRIEQVRPELSGSEILGRNTPLPPKESNGPDEPDKDIV